ncbi:MAG: hypothetical protein AAGM67_12235, partial [Bacteroidota bacterium]
MDRLSHISSRISALWRQFPVWFRRLCRTFGAIFLLFLLANLLFPLKVNIEYSPTLVDRNGKVLYSFLSYDDKWRLKLPEEEI